MKSIQFAIVINGVTSGKCTPKSFKNLILIRQGEAIVFRVIQLIPKTAKGKNDRYY